MLAGGTNFHVKFFLAGSVRNIQFQQQNTPSFFLKVYHETHSKTRNILRKPQAGCKGISDTEMQEERPLWLVFSSVYGIIVSLSDN